MQLLNLIDILNSHQVQFILIGGVAGIIHGAARATSDVDVVYNRSPENLSKIVVALRPYNPYLRGAPEGLPFVWDEKTFRNSINITLTTTLGDIDFLGEVTGGGNYQQLLPFSEEIELFNKICQVVNLKKLIELKKAAGRPKDFEAIAELELIQEKRS